MAESNKQIENRQWQTDALVYEAIRYLDSPTDYREYLLYTAQSKVQNQEHPKESAVENNDFILLDEAPMYQLNWLWSLALIAVLLGVVLLGLLQN